MLLYFNLLKVTLFNKPKQVQEYYTEHTNFQDIIGHINEFALAMLHEGKALYGLKIYNSLLRHINYYKIVCVQEIVFTATSFIEAFSDLKDIIQIKRYLNELMNMTEMLLVQTYLYTTVDLSYCRLAKHEDKLYCSLVALLKKDTPLLRNRTSERLSPISMTQQESLFDLTPLPIPCSIL